ncbi:MAG: hypothetical protein JSR82_17690 [Verrucomicrobia bacterium]|nr:hypothetical protein [Verrucomicrobiota bacterium]
MEAFQQVEVRPRDPEVRLGITRDLLGANPKNTRFVDPASVTVNARGEMLDAFGHPYFFHAISGTRMEIRSAGPDGRLFTEDDIVK